jgi:hypothetical protein
MRRDPYKSGSLNRSSGRYNSEILDELGNVWRAGSESDLKGLRIAVCVPSAWKLHHNKATNLARPFMYFGLGGVNFPFSSGTGTMSNACRREEQMSMMLLRPSFFPGHDLRLSR